MAQRRQGHCPNCPHDIIDPRDLKFYRNVCGFWFHPADDAFRWRDNLRLARAGLAEVVFSSSVCVVALTLVAVLALWTQQLWLWGIAAILAVLWFQLVYFFRDPKRTIPADPALLLSPADGVVTHIDEVNAPEFPEGRAFRVSIYLSLWNVHLNRLPRSGRVVAVRYFPGCFLNARHKDCWVRNEQLWVDLEEATTGRRVRIKQISGAMARRLVCWLKVGEDVRAGERYGMIKYGSRADVLIPVSDAVEVLVRVGDKVQAGSSVLLRFKEATT